MCHVVSFLTHCVVRLIAAKLSTASSSFESWNCLHLGTFEQPAKLMERTRCLKYDGGHVPTWVVQGKGDEICPEEFAQALVHSLEQLGVLEDAHFVDAGHAAHSDGIGAALKLCVADFHEKHAQVSTESPKFRSKL